MKLRGFRDPSIFILVGSVLLPPVQKKKEFSHIPNTSGICPGCAEGLSIRYLRLSAGQYLTPDPPSSTICVCIKKWILRHNLLFFFEGRVEQVQPEFNRKIELSRLNLIVFVKKSSLADVVEPAELDVETVKRCSKGLRAIPYTPQQRRFCAQIELSQSRAGPTRITDFFSCFAE